MRLHLNSQIRVWSVLAAVSLAGCSGGSMRSFFGPPDSDVNDEVAVATAPPPAATPVPTRAAPKEPSRAPIKPAQTRSARPIVPAPMMTVAGLSEAEVLDVMGEPQQRTERGGRRVWTYVGTGCRVEVTFFRDVTRDAYAALSQKVVGTSGAARENCVRDVRSAAR